ncbi:MAG: tetratricopeptide repeat protein [Bdellovibrio sp.]
MNSAMQAFKKQDYKRAASQFYRIVFATSSTSKDKLAARYYLGVSLVKLKMYQTAAFPLIIAAKDAPPKASQKAFQNLVIISENLNDSTLLDYTLKKLDASDLSEIAQELYHNRMGQALMKEEKYSEAIEHLKKSLQLKPDNDETLYSLGLVYLKQNNTAEALPYLEKLHDKYFSRDATDPKRGTTAMGLARAYYQAKKWAEAVNLYRQIPKDHPLYRDAQVELTWSLFRWAKFRSAMSAIQTLHTPFYENFYDPESLILRTIILLFICQNNDAEKALATFHNNYASSYNVIADLNKSNRPPEFYAGQIESAQKYLAGLKAGKPTSYSGQVPFFIVRALIDKAPLKNKLIYIDKIQEEKNLAQRLFASAADAPLRKYALKILNERQKKCPQRHRQSPTRSPAGQRTRALPAHRRCRPPTL